MPTDYSTLLDAQTRAFIDRVEAFYPPEAARWPIARSREVYDRMSRAFHAGHPAGVAARTTAFEAGGREIAIRLYRYEHGGADAVILYLHGGGFILGGLDSHDDICAELCAGTGFEVISVDYRLAPEHLHTAAFDDAVAAFEWAAASRARPVVLVGESAGGNLAACVAHHARRHPAPPAGVVLVYPSLDGRRDTPSCRIHAEAPLLSARDLDFYDGVRSEGSDVSQDPRYTPLADTDFTGLPPTAIFTAECDPLSSDGETYCRRVEADGGRAFWREEKGLPHGYLRARHQVARAGKGFARIVEATGLLGRRRWIE